MILRKLKRLLGMGSGSDETGRSERDVVVQEEPSAADTETEAAVKGVDVEDDEGTESTEEGKSTDEEESVGSGDVDEPVAATTDADASTESLVDEKETQEHPESRAEPAEAAGPGAADETTDVGDVEAGDEDAAVAAEGTDVDEIKGIGPAYSDRLDEVGIHNVEELADADAAELAERITVSEKTVQKWIDRAQAFEE